MMNTGIEKEKDIFLNGEVQEIKKVPDYVPPRAISNRVERPVRKTIVCLKCLQVDDNLKGQALRNVFNR